MTGVAGALFIAAFSSLAIGLTAAVGAHLAADHSKRSGAVPKSTKDFFVFSKSPLLFGVVPSISAIFSDVHRRYDSRFITRCFHIARVTLLLGVVVLAGAAVFGLLA